MADKPLPRNRYHAVSGIMKIDRNPSLAPRKRLPCKNTKKSKNEMTNGGESFLTVKRPTLFPLRTYSRKSSFSASDSEASTVDTSIRVKQETPYSLQEKASETNYLQKPAILKISTVCKINNEIMSISSFPEHNLHSHENTVLVVGKKNNMLKKSVSKIREPRARALVKNKKIKNNRGLHLKNRKAVQRLPKKQESEAKQQENPTLSLRILKKKKRVPMKAKIELHKSIKVLNSPKNINGTQKREHSSSPDVSQRKIKKISHPTSIPESFYKSYSDILTKEADEAPFVPVDSAIQDEMLGHAARGGIFDVSADYSTPHGTSEYPQLLFIPEKEDNTMLAPDKSKVNPASGSFLPEMKSIKRKPKKSKELEQLYKNLDEISWTKEKSFKDMLVTKDGMFHSKRVVRKYKTVKKLKHVQSLVKAVEQKKKPVVNDRSVIRKKTIVPPLRSKPLKLGPTKKDLLVKKLKKNAIKKKNVVKVKIPRLKENKKITSQKTKHSSGNKSSNHVSKNTKESCAIDKPKLLQSSKKSLLKNKKTLQKEKLKITGLKNASTSCDKSQLNSCSVALKPLEHTGLLNETLQNIIKSNFENSRKEFLQQAVHKVYSGLDQEHISSVYRELQDSLGTPIDVVKASKKKRDEESIRSSIRQSECAFRYKEIVVKKHPNYIQVVLVPNNNKQNSLTIEAMKELKEAFIVAKKDPNCRAVLLNSSGTYFCTGIDLGLLIGPNKKQLAEEMATTVRDLITTLGYFTKPVVAAVNGTAIGLGVSILTFCDVVLASDKATFCIPATRLGYIPEAAATFTLPQVVGTGVAMEMLLQGRRLTAQQALRHGLVSEVLWPTQLMEEVIPRMQVLVSQQLQVMEATKTMVRCHTWDKLPSQLELEWRLLPPLWLAPACQSNIKRLLQTGWLFD